MKIIKLGHCCLLIEHKGKRILTDPGGFTVGAQRDLQEIDIILITHDHGDHLHVESLQEIMKSNPNAMIVTNSSVKKRLDEKEITCSVVEHENSKECEGTILEGFGEEHAEIFGDFGATQNTGYFIDDYFFYPGDAFTNPGKNVPVLAVPIAGPWMALKEAISYVNSVKPEMCFPVHDHVLSDDGRGIHFRVFANNIDAGNTEFKELREGEELEV